MAESDVEGAVHRLARLVDRRLPRPVECSDVHLLAAMHRDSLDVVPMTRARPTASRGAEDAQGSVQRRSVPLGPDLGPEDVQAVLASLRASRPRKYRNEPVERDGYRFDSAKEAERYGVLLALEQAGAISKLEVHPRFPLVVHGEDCGDYVADFAYIDPIGRSRVEDVKSPVTRKLPSYRLRRRLVWALYGIGIEEV